MKRALRNDETKAKALELALALKTPSLFRTVKDDVDGPDEAGIVELGLMTNDDGAAEFLAKRWVEVGTDSASFGYLQSGFETYAIALDGIKVFEDVLEGERKSMAAKIVKFQFGAESDDPAKLLSKWDDLEEAYEFDAMEFEVSGAALLPDAKIGGTVHKIGPNYRLVKDGVVSCAIPKEYESGDFTLSVRVRATEDGSQVVASMGPGMWDLKYKGGEWTNELKSSGDNFAVGVEPGEWALISFIVEDVSRENESGVRKGEIQVNGESLVNPAQFGGDNITLEVEANGTATVVAAAQIAR